MKHSLAYLHQRLDYNPITGIFTWNRIPEFDKNDRMFNTRYAETRAGSAPTGRHGRFINLDGRLIPEHRLAWYMSYGEWLVSRIDHINQDPTDNRLKNLREATCSQNRCNVQRHRGNSSGFKGVSFHEGKWVARIGRNYQNYNLGRFDTPEEAHAAYCKAAAELHGEFCCF